MLVQRTMIDVPGLAIKAKRFKDPAKVAAQSVENVQVTTLAFRHFGLKLFEVHFQGCGPTAQTFLAFR
jgi:hypothetical protein